MERFKHKNALLIDDSYIDNLINRKILEKSNYAENIKVIDFPKVGIEFVKESILSGLNTPSVIFLDLRMPDMSGFEFLKALENIPELKPGQIKIYILSSSLDPSDMKRVKENKLVAKFIGKPLTSQALAEI
ncbi:response regulator [Daejeonella oryzae]|uniref:response regulator n=1 Tax=Daejeonella oryzae TaxID=1122943 RepID=UPI00047CA270|nr:response regulator [Daejeonella oryzae]